MFSGLSFFSEPKIGTLANYLSPFFILQIFFFGRRSVIQKLMIFLNTHKKEGNIESFKWWRSAFQQTFRDCALCKFPKMIKKRIKFIVIIVALELGTSSIVILLNFELTSHSTQLYKSSTLIMCLRRDLSLLLFSFLLQSLRFAVCRCKLAPLFLIFYIYTCIFHV